MAPPANLQKTVEIVQASWKQIVREQRLKTRNIIGFCRDLQLALRFDARRAPWRAPVVAGDASTATERAPREARPPGGARTRTSDVGLFYRRSTPA